MSDLTHTALGTAITLKVNIQGDEYADLNLSLAELKAFPQHVLDEVTLTCLSGAGKGCIKNYCGALLRDVIGHIGLEAADRRVLKQMLVIARAHDNYSAIFSWNELFNTAVGDGVFVLYEKNDESLGAREADVALISANDLRNAPRHVKGLKVIELYKLPEL